MAKEICQDCEKIFEGGKNAFLCPKCRKKRVEIGKKKSREKREDKKMSRYIDAELIEKYISREEHNTPDEKMET